MRWSNLTLSEDEQRRLPGYRDEAVVRRFDAPEALETRFYEVRARSVLNRVPGKSQVPFRWTINPYRGCAHACVYCFARPTHRYLGFDAGRDFEREIVVKVNAPEVLRVELARPSWKGEHVALGTNTDPYQWVEGRYRLMQGIWAALRDAANPCSVLTKSPLLLRDLPLLLEIAQRTQISASLSIPTLDERAWRATEPHTPNPRARLEAVAELNRAGIPTGVLIAPLMPGINDAPHQIEPLLARAAEAGAVAATVALLAGCGSSGSSTTTTGATAKSTSAANNSAYGETQSTQTAASTTGSTSTPASTGVLIVSKHSHDGTILAAGPKRLTVYMFEGDKGSTSSCSGACAQVWPPVTTAAAATVAGGAIAADLGTTTRADGTKQVTYKGHPLYFFAKDKDDGDAYGQGVHGFGADWYVLKPSGVKVDNS